jgi:hypothetical protein
MYAAEYVFTGNALLQPIFPVLVLASVQITLELKAFKGI